MNAIDRCT